MKILHTSDWHLGKTFENAYSRLEEQRQFLEELCEIADKNQVDMILVAGDIYDTVNPSAEAEKLFYTGMLALSCNGQRPVIVVAGNHDSPERLTAAAAMASEHGVILIGSMHNPVLLQKTPFFEIYESGAGYFKIKIKEESATVLTLPYPNEKRLKALIFKDEEEMEMQKSYSDKVKEIWDSLMAQQTEPGIVVAVSHLFVLGGEESGSERSLSLGGSLRVAYSALPKASYVALGHLHRAQHMGGNVYYSGSPIQYDRSEANQSKLVYLVHVTQGQETTVEKVLLKNYKPIAVWKAASFEEAVAVLEENAGKNLWAYLDITAQLTMEEIKAIRHLRDDVQIRMLLTSNQNDAEDDFGEERKKPLSEQFQAFYKNQRGDDAPEDLVQLFLEIAESEEE